jgi:hypothetical protein
LNLSQGDLLQFFNTVSGAVDGEGRMTIDAAPIRSSTSGAPVCLAALIARAISAWVKLAGRRDIVEISKKKAPLERGKTSSFDYFCVQAQRPGVASMHGGCVRLFLDAIVTHAW